MHTYANYTTDYNCTTSMAGQIQSTNVNTRKTRVGKYNDGRKRANTKTEPWISTYICTEYVQCLVVCGGLGAMSDCDAGSWGLFYSYMYGVSIVRSTVTTPYILRTYLHISSMINTRTLMAPDATQRNATQLNKGNELLTNHHPSHH